MTVPALVCVSLVSITLPSLQVFASVISSITVSTLTPVIFAPLDVSSALILSPVLSVMPQKTSNLSMDYVNVFLECTQAQESASLVTQWQVVSTVTLQAVLYVMTFSDSCSILIKNASVITAFSSMT